MTPAPISDEDVARLKAALAPATPPAPQRVGARVKQAVRRAAVPLVARARRELLVASAGDDGDLRRQIADLRGELARTRADHGAEIAALHEELADRSRTEPVHP